MTQILLVITTTLLTIVLFLLMVEITMLRIDFEELNGAVNAHIEHDVTPAKKPRREAVDVTV